jgi:hypothetical protein
VCDPCHFSPDAIFNEIAVLVINDDDNGWPPPPPSPSLHPIGQF